MMGATLGHHILRRARVLHMLDQLNEQALEFHNRSRGPLLQGT